MTDKDRPYETPDWSWCPVPGFAALVPQIKPEGPAIRWPENFS